MIELDKIFIRRDNNKVFFCATIKIDHIVQELWFSTDKKFEKYIALTNGDCFALALFIYAIFTNKSFICNVPVSKRLKYGLIHVLLNTFIKNGVCSKELTIDFKFEDETTFPDATGIGTAMSLGVDSFYTLSKNIESSHAVNILTLFNGGAYGEYGGDVARDLFEKMKQHVSNLSEDFGLDFLWVDTNLNEVLKMPFVKTHTFRNFACVLMFQKLFKTYYYASGTTLDNFKLNFNDPMYYDLLNSKAIAGNSLEFHISGLNEGRLFKTQVISEHPLTFNNLNVCLITSDNEKLSKNNKKLINCSKCFKCIRTMVTLEVLGKLHLYKNVFDLNVYKENKEKYLAEILYNKIRANNIFSQEILGQIKLNKYHISYKVYYYLFLRVLQPLGKRINNSKNLKY
ncbi:hypothetical protein [Thalassobellus suaedae]|uniref:Uncharacterized protein n=1 Tax=Thalassobellus suaedae TaxID=3074124 RepID=A0ABY9Y297_9FLAO|nr:hypothetical protein RHP49_15230 [Flavobacteriaceae bacterium HL-DH10]